MLLPPSVGCVVSWSLEAFGGLKRSLLNELAEWGRENRLWQFLSVLIRRFLSERGCSFGLATTGCFRTFQIFRVELRLTTPRGGASESGRERGDGHPGVEWPVWPASHQCCHQRVLWAAAYHMRSAGSKRNQKSVKCPNLELESQKCVRVPGRRMSDMRSILSMLHMLCIIVACYSIM